MKKYFITGLAILLPVALTIVIVLFFYNLLTSPFLDFVEGLLDRFQILQDGFWVFNAHQIKVFISRLLIFVFLFLFTLLLGALTRWYVLNWLLGKGEYVLARIPIVNSLYTTFKDLSHTIFTSDATGFKQVVLLPFPHPESQTLGLVTKEEIIVEGGMKRVAVFVPTTPNPTSGYLLLIKPEDLIYLDLQVEEALKYIISCGVVLVPLKKITAEEAKRRLLEEFEEVHEKD